MIDVNKLTAPVVYYGLGLEVGLYDLETKSLIKSDHSNFIKSAHRFHRDYYRGGRISCEITPDPRRAPLVNIIYTGRLDSVYGILEVIKPWYIGNNFNGCSMVLQNAIEGETPKEVLFPKAVIHITSENRIEDIDRISRLISLLVDVPMILMGSKSKLDLRRTACGYKKSVEIVNTFEPYDMVYESLSPAYFRGLTFVSWIFGQLNLALRISSDIVASNNVINAFSAELLDLVLNYSKEEHFIAAKKEFLNLMKRFPHELDDKFNLVNLENRAAWLFLTENREYFKKQFNSVLAKNSTSMQQRTLFTTLRNVKEFVSMMSAQNKKELFNE